MIVKPFTMWFALTFTDEVELIDLSDPQPGQVGWFFDPELLAWFPGEIPKPKKPQLVDGREVRESVRGFEIYSLIVKKSFRFGPTSAAVSPSHAAPVPSPVVVYGLADGRFYRIAMEATGAGIYKANTTDRRRWFPTAELLTRFHLTPAEAAFNQARLGTSLWDRYDSAWLLVEKRMIEEEADPIRQVERREEYEKKLAEETDEADDMYEYEVGDAVRVEIRHREDGGWSLGEVTKIDQEMITVRVISAYNRGGLYYVDLVVARGRDEWMIVPADDDHPLIVYQQVVYKEKLYPIVDLQLTAEGDQLALLKGVDRPVPTDELSDPEKHQGPLLGGQQRMRDLHRDEVFIDPRQPTPSLITRKEENDLPALEDEEDW